MGGCVIFSGNADNGLNAGSFYLNANNGTSNANENIDSGDLLHKTNTTSPCLQVGRTKNYAPLLALELGLNNKLLRGSRYES